MGPMILLLEAIWIIKQQIVALVNLVHTKNAF